MIVVTGAAGFIASCLIKKLQAEGATKLVAVDLFNDKDKKKNLESLSNITFVEREYFFSWLSENKTDIELIYHIGARTDTTEFDRELLWKLNTDYTKKVWQMCSEYKIPLLYASSAATYGLGEHGYDDNHDIIEKLHPLNAYGDSKNEFDIWALKKVAKGEAPPYWYGMKFFNVYGPNEFHKGRMASVIMHAYNQIKQTGKMKLFRSHNEKYKDGEQQRDFVYVKDVIEVLVWLMHHKKNSGLYNMGSGQARTFLELVKATFLAMKKEEHISFIDTPTDIREKYQYFTEANMKKLRSIGFKKEFYTLEAGVKDYVENYLIQNKYF